GSSGAPGSAARLAGVEDAERSEGAGRFAATGEPVPSLPPPRGNPSAAAGDRAPAEEPAGRKPSQKSISPFRSAPSGSASWRAGCAAPDGSRGPVSPPWVAGRPADAPPPAS